MPNNVATAVAHSGAKREVPGAAGGTPALPSDSTLAAFNGFYTTAGHLTVMDQNRVLGALAIAALVILILLIWGLWRLWRRMRRKPAVSA